MIPQIRSNYSSLIQCRNKNLRPETIHNREPHALIMNENTIVFINHPEASVPKARCFRGAKRPFRGAYASVKFGVSARSDEARGKEAVEAGKPGIIRLKI
jgi:hypothetical protein